MTSPRHNSEDKRFRVALSFAGEKRDFVAQVAAILGRRFGEAAVLYDKYHEAELARSDLGTYLPDLYHDQSDLIVVVVCENYDAKEWCGLEWSAIFDLVKKRKHDEVMLCRFNLATVKGLYSTAGFLELDDKKPDEVARCILERLALNEGKSKNHYLSHGALSTTRKHVAGPPAPSTTTSSGLPDALSRPTVSHEFVIKLDPGATGPGEHPRIPRELPPAAYKFFGREAERRTLVERLRAGLNTAVVGPAGLGKTALAAAALAEVVGKNAANLGANPFPDGLVYLDLYTFHGEAEPAWNALANRICGAEFMDRWPASERATEACRARRLLVIIEGGEEADGSAGRVTIPELLGVLSQENRRLLLTRLSAQAAMAETVEVKDALDPGNAEALLDWLTERKPLDAQVRQSVLELLDGHPLALNWAGNLLVRDEEDPAGLVDEWAMGGLPKLSDPSRSERTLHWLFNRSVRGLDDMTLQALAAAGLLAHAPFPLGATVAAIGGMDAGHSDGKRARDALKSLVQHGLLRRADTAQWQFTHVMGYRFSRSEEGSDPALRERLGRWLSDDLKAALKTTANGETLGGPANLLQHAGALLRADEDQRLWELLAHPLLYGIADRLEEIGRLDLVVSALGAVAGWLARFPKSKANEPFWRGQRCVLIVDQGDVLRSQGDLSGALTAYRESLALSRRLAESDPSNAGWQRDLSVSQEKIGDVLRSQGDLSGALTAYRESLALRRRLAESDPSNAGWQRDLSWILTRLAEFHERQDDGAAALSLAQESLSIDERLSALDPTNVTWQTDVAVSRALVARLRRGSR